MSERYESVSRIGALSSMSHTYIRRDDYRIVSGGLEKVRVVLTMPSVSLLIPWSNIFNLTLPNAPTRSPSGGPSLMSRSRESASAAIGLFLETGRLPAELGLGGVMLVASLFDLPRLICGREGLFAGDRFRCSTCLCC
jgi:hypothetical protein